MNSLPRLSVLCAALIVAMPALAQAPADAPATILVTSARSGSETQLPFDPVDTSVRESEHGSTP